MNDTIQKVNARILQLTEPFMTAQEIALVCKVCKQAILDRLHRYGLEPVSALRGIKTGRHGLQYWNVSELQKAVRNRYKLP